MIYNYKENKEFMETLTRSRIYQDYAKAFTEATGVPISLRPIESWQLAHYDQKKKAPFCALMEEENWSCALCLRVQQNVCNTAQQVPHTLTCPAGLCETAVPIRIGDRLIGFVQTGQVFQEKPSMARFDRFSKLLSRSGSPLDLERLREAYFATPVISSVQYDAVVTLLTFFARQLSVLANQALIQAQTDEPPMVQNAKKYILEHQGQNLRLKEIASAVGCNVFSFCKMFKRATGFTFTQYVARLRTEKAKNLLLNPNLRITEICFEAGFGSLTHFNRTFKMVLGQSPTQYRAQLPGL